MGATVAGARAAGKPSTFQPVRRPPPPRPPLSSPLSPADFPLAASCAVATLPRLFSMLRTHHCNSLAVADADAKIQVSLIGWVDTVRDLGGVRFVDLRDREGITQIVFNPERAEIHAQAHRLKDESVIQVTGTVVRRDADTVNPKMGTGEVEVVAESLVIHNVCQPLPFPMEDDKADKVGEDLRLEYRYLDLRRPRMLNLVKTRALAARTIRRTLEDEGFLEVETPVLFKSTPEGAREFLVPSRLSTGSFYALSQSPQQYKQMLMVAGVEKYYQLARCFRDEDLRADRQLEFTQVDIEMSFIEREDMYALVEKMLAATWKSVLGIDIPTPFPRMSYQAAMDRYGVDKPDTRFDIEITDFTDLFKNSGFKVFNSIANSSGGVVRAINAKGFADITQGELVNLENIAKTLGAKGLAFIKSENGEWKSPILKFFSDDEKAVLKERLNIEDGDIVFFAAAPWEQACAILGRIRLEAAAYLRQRGKIVIPPDKFNFLWVIEFPLMLWDAEEKRFLSAHHPFTAPVKEDEPLLATAPEKVRGQHYDIVLNGVELGGGSIRIHNPEMQKHVFEDVLKIPADVVESRFGYMLKAFSYGAPPHGGIALGLDRLVAMLAGRSSIRDIIAFPKTQKGQDLMAESPAPVTPKQLRDLHIALTEPEAKGK
ncbi:MAG: aspartate--tRNA ligase [Puniceicoccales bacterium]|jgi:aspartyl-tRNA synthetase|nr:aspartate--tRNA ligase [Puniceicoccales bacterium]